MAVAKEATTLASTVHGSMHAVDTTTYLLEALS
jgi:hypothetical protein